MTKLQRWVKKNGGVKTVAKRFKCSDSMLYSIMNGTRKPSLLQTNKIAKVTGIPKKQIRPDINRLWERL